MVSKTSKSKEKKAMRKEHLAKLGAAQQLLNKANDPNNQHLDNFPPFKKFSRNGYDLSIECKHTDKLDTESFDAIFKILETNMKPEYEACDWGWNEKEKIAEFKEKDPWFLIARDTTTNVIGAFAHFKFDFDEEIEVLYCYEVQVADEFRSRGIGKFLMQILELIGAKASMQKIMITVFKHNNRAVHFFADILKYKDDETSPKFMDPIAGVEEEEYCYDIMSKPLKKAAPTKT